MQVLYDTVAKQTKSTIQQFKSKENKELNYKKLSNVSKIQSSLKEFIFNYVEKYGWPKIIHQFTLKILFLIKNLLKVTLFSVKIL
ncbi:hypothetical protein [Spiroplasma endosymbiont of Amphimallon solstitiale]|uniref:hypothetical protein n=1 Tax=Spiroplasma endosymbiont of Amphimallon solstitiale TaxID=3066288 RepID=UPI00313D1788